ncbi:class I SAM-dependent methyltransferase [Solidesulfovibrio sp.]|uniref:class I SAM-dependent methyltransferase n=1 Tax=Solidesulfovibrio sp. TaxID=2910990 RepID=UPI002622F5B4|nr:class I SAM-dependent methyltransferase [Solidesulfovibrio sp.]
MAQAKKNDASQLVKYAIDLLVHGTAQDWKSHYRLREFQDVMAEKAKDAILLDFEYKDRRKLYRCVNQRFVGNRPVDYLEFGVAGGESFRAWLELNANADSRFFGFDSFQGLPEDWGADNPKGTFSRQGRVPEFGDGRARIVDGLFQETVDAFSRSFTPRNALVLHMDADLYSSTLYCLMQMQRHIAPGTIILFDEFTARDCTDEYAALQDFCQACCRDYAVLAARRDYVKLAVEITR